MRIRRLARPDESFFSRYEMTETRKLVTALQDEARVNAERARTESSLAADD